ncbi:hypothetical protein TorRG33x02_219960, partial [Trema orientale]
GQRPRKWQSLELRKRLATICCWSCSSVSLIKRYLIRCSGVFSRTQYGIYNPLTRQLLWLPDAPNDGRNGFFHEFSDLYDPKCGFVRELKNDGRYREIENGENCHVHRDRLALCVILMILLRGVEFYTPPVGVGDVGIVAFDPSVDSTSEEDDRKICRLISMPINFVGCLSEVFFGVVRGPAAVISDGQDEEWKI